MTTNDYNVRSPLVVVPTYNEVDNVNGLLDRLRAAAPEAHLLVVDDNSPDGTARRVELRTRHDPHVHLLTRKRKDGLGSAYRAGFAWALERDYDAVVQIDADLSHPPELVPVLLTSLSTAHVAVGSRYVPGGDVAGWTRSRRAISRAGNAYARYVLSLEIHDVTAGFKAFRRDALLTCGALESTSDGYCFQIENAWRASRTGLVVAEVPITFVDRAHGSSKMSSTIALETLWRVLMWRAAEITTPRRAGHGTRQVAGSHR